MGVQTFYPAPGLMFTIDIGGAVGPVKINSIEYHSETDYVLLNNLDEPMVSQEIGAAPFNELPIEVWFNIPRQ